MSLLRVRFLFTSLFTLMSVTIALSACGGGGSGGASGDTIIAPVPVLSISAVTPLSAYSGETLQVQGLGLNRVNKALISGVAGSISAQSSTQLSFVVPTGALSGVVELQAPGSVALSLERVTILNSPAVSGMSPVIAKPGDSVTISGSNLDQVREVRINDLLLTLTQKTATLLSFIVPAEARSGSVKLMYGNALFLQVPQSLTIQTPVILRSFSPAEGLVGSTVIIDGEGLDLVESVLFGTQGATPVQRNVNRLTLVVPLGASSGPLTLIKFDAGKVISGSNFSVIPKIIFTDLQPSAARVGLTITISGQNFAEISGVTVNGNSVNLLTRSATALTFAMPAGGGFVLLKGVRQADVAAGVLTEQPPGVSVTGFSPTSGVVGSQIDITGMNLDKVSSASIGGVAASIISRTSGAMALQVPNAGNGAIVLVAEGTKLNIGNFTLTTGPSKATVTITRVELAQTYLQAPGDTYQRLVPNKSALLRVFVAGQDGSASPPVQLSASAGTIALGSVQLPGPGTLSATPQASVLTQTFNTKLPANWLRANLTLTIEVDPNKTTTNGASYTARPVIGTASNLNLVLVPLSISEGNVEAVLPDLGTIQTLLGKVFPLSETTIKLTQRAPYRLTSVTQVKTDDEWSKALSELDTLRDTEGQLKHYYGFVPDANFQGGNSGLGYVPGRALGGDSRTAIGLDARQSFVLRTMTHELGHNFGRDHAPCGDVTSPDSAFPYPNGGLGPTLIYDNVAEIIAVISKPSDVMGYCNGSWFSDYNYFHVQNWLEAWLYPTAQAMKVYASSVELLEIAGEITAQGVRFQPVFGSIGQTPLAHGEYQLRLRLSDGSQIDAPFSVVKVADASGALLHFKLKIVKPALEIVAMEVLKAGQVLPVNQGKSTSVAAEKKLDNSGPSLSWQEQDQQLYLSWNDSRYHYLSVRHLGAVSTLIAQQLQGGKAQLSTATLPPGGEWQLVLSDGLNTRLIRVKR
ncbi:MAG: IPT/TIG domain-containing protein [Pseudomonadota bacterium]